MSAPPADGFIEQDARGVTSGWSAASERMFGWPHAEAIGMASNRLIPERNRARHGKALQEFIASPDRRIPRREITALHRDGREFRAEFAICLEGRGEALRVTPTVRATDAIRASERATVQRVRIVAMTAREIRGDRGCCLAGAGYLAPIDQRSLCAAVEG
jgi:PAS domain S-box-containing protein